MKLLFSFIPLKSTKAPTAFDPIYAFFFITTHIHFVSKNLFSQVRHTNRNIVRPAKGIGNLNDPVTGLEAVAALKDNLV